jgi:flagellar hook protein FlgE
MSYYTSISGLKNAQTDLGVIAHNIANTETNGFKKSNASFSDVVARSAMSDPRKTMGIGARLQSITQNFSLGSTEQTGSALDLAINGSGFFALKAAEDGSMSYTRNGALELDRNGYIHDGSDNRLQLFAVDANGAVTSTTPVDALIPAANAGGAEFVGLTIREDGLVTANYADSSVNPVGRVALANFASTTGLQQVGSTKWEATGLSGQPTYGEAGVGMNGSLLSGTLERSNVDIAEELVGLISAQRNFQANAKAIDTATRITETIINLRT